MEIFAYLYSDPLLESSPDQSIWGQEVDRVYQDLGKRQQLQQLIKDCEEKTPNYLLIRRLEELGETVKDVSDRLTQLESLGIQIIATEQNYTSSHFKTGNSVEILNNLGKIFQEINVNQHRRQLQKGHAKNRINALPPPGKAPYGYRRGKERYILDRSTAPVIKDFFDRFLLLGSLRGTVRYLEKRYGKKISVSTGHRWLTNPVYRGDLAYKNNEVISDTHTPIISREEAAQIDRLLRRNRQLPSRTASAPRSLAGLVVCQKCQSSMKITQVKTRDRKKEYLYLRPQNCLLKPKCKGIPYKDILTKTIEHICQYLPPTVSQLSLPNIDQLKQEFQDSINQKQEIINQLPTLMEKGILDAETVQFRRYNLYQEIAQIRDKLEQLPPGNLNIIVKAVSLPRFWQDLSEAERRFYFREFIHQIQVIPIAPKIWDLELVFVF